MEATGSEAAFLARLAGSAHEVLVRLENGETVQGRLEWIDRTCLKLRRPDRPPVVVMKHAIVTVEAAPDGRRG